MITYILNESGEWVEGEPTENGQRYKVVYADGGSIESIYSAPVNPLITITITDIDGEVSHTENFSKVAVYENTPMLITGTGDADDQTFAFTLTRNDSRMYLFYAEIVSNVLTVTVNIPESGLYSISTDTINADPDNIQYTITPMTFEVLRDVGNPSNDFGNYVYGLYR